MSFLDAHLLTAITGLPTLGAVVLFFVAREEARLLKPLALLTSLGSLALTLRALMRFDGANDGLQLVEKAPWIPTMHVDYFVAVDGVGMLLVLLTALVVPLAIAATSTTEANARTRFTLILVMQTAMFGVFTALNFFHWFIWWEVSLVPAYFLIKMYGGDDAHRTSLKFLIFTLVGSVAMLLAFQAIYLATGSFDFIELASMARNGSLETKLGTLAADAGLGWQASTCGAIAFGAIVLAFAVKAPLWPFHTWLPGAYCEAPSSTTMLLTAILSKMGVYGLLRIALPLFPDAATAAAPVLLALAVITVVYAAFAALAQTDLKRALAFSSVNHVGYCLVALFALMLPSSSASPGMLPHRVAALDGVALQMFNHGVTAAALFFMLGLLEQRAAPFRDVGDFGGLRKIAPRFSLVFGIALFSSLGLPGLNSFVGELLIFKGVVGLSPAVAGVSCIGIIVTAVFLLRIVQRVFAGPANPRWSSLPDLSWRELAIALPFVAIMVAAGLYPGPLVEIVDATAAQLAQTLAGGAR